MEELIEEVHAREILWNRFHARYNDRPLVDKEWDSLSQNTEFTKVEAKKKWRNLRDQFLKELKKIPAAKLCEPLDQFVARNHSKWQYFKQLAFLKDVLAPKNEYSSEVEESLSAEDDFFDENVVKTDVEEAEVRLDCSSTTAPNQAKRLSDSKETRISKRIMLSQDDDYMFFKSLLPYMKQLQPVQKLKIRSKFHDILIQELS